MLLFRCIQLGVLDNGTKSPEAGGSGPCMGPPLLEFEGAGSGGKGVQSNCPALKALEKEFASRMFIPTILKITSPAMLLDHPRGMLLRVCHCFIGTRDLFLLDRHPSNMGSPSFQLKTHQYA